MRKLFFIVMLTAAWGVQAQVKNISINEVPDKLEKKAVLVDVRTPEEFSEGHLPGALNIDIKSEGFTDKISRIRKSKNVLLYCRSGRRSARAATIMDSLGYSKVYNLEGGYIAWEEKHKETPENR